MGLKICQVGEPVLRAPARELRRAEILGRPVQQLIEEMRETMRAAPGVGLAAPQVGEGLRLAVIEDHPDYVAGLSPEARADRERAAVPFHVIINPRLEAEPGEEVEFFEGCLSLAGYVALVSRARAVRVTCLDERAEERVIRARGWYARILQHEIDHLGGVLYIDRMLTRTFMTAENFARHWADKSLAEIRAALG
jgi:peptide deformylase